MSNLLIIDGGQYAIRGGRLNHERAELSVSLYRNGAHFEIYVRQIDVTGTEFEKKWLSTVSRSTDDTAMPNWTLNWGKHCHLVILQSFNMLYDLSPAPDRWNKLEGYLITPHYELKLTTHGQDAAPMVICGPIVKPAFQFSAVPGGQELFGVPADLSVVSSSELTVIGQQKHYRASPYKVRSSDGTTHYLITCEASVTDVATNAVLNDSLETISAYLKICKNRLPVRVPEVTGVFLTSTMPHNDQKVDWALRGAVAVADKCVAGILLRYLPHARDLSEINCVRPKSSFPWSLPPGRQTRKKLDSIPDLARLNEWEKELERTLRILHANDLVVGHLHAYNVLIYEDEIFLNRPWGLRKKAIPQYKQGYLEDMETQKADEMQKEEKGQPVEKKSFSEQIKDRLAAVEGWKIEFDDPQAQKESGVKALEDMFQKVREGLEKEE